MKSIIEQGRSHEAGTYVGEGDWSLFDSAELRQGVDVAVLEAFGGGIGEATPSPFPEVAPIMTIRFIIPNFYLPTISCAKPAGE